MSRCCNSREILRDKKIKATRQRLELLDQIMLLDTMFTAQKLYELLSSSMDLVTIYRILQIFQEKGIIREVLGNCETKMFEMACKHNPIHPHFICNSCKEVLCLPVVDEKIIQSIRDSYSNLDIDKVSIHLSGLCKKCEDDINYLID